MGEADISYRYLTSLHWSLTNFQGTMDVFPGTTNERAFAVVVLYSGLVIVSYFISTITHIMSQIQKIRSEKMLQRWKLVRYLYDSHVSPDLTVRVKQFVDRVAKTQRNGQDDVELLKVLPEQLTRDLDCEIKGPALRTHPLLNNLVHNNETLGRKMYDAAHQSSLHYGELLFPKGQRCHRMCIIADGRLKYSKGDLPMEKSDKTFMRSVTGKQAWQNGKDNEKSYVEKGKWVCEMVLWTQWVHKGDLTAVTRADIFSLDSQAFQVLMLDFEEKASKAARRGRRFVDWMNRTESLDDLSCKPIRFARPSRFGSQGDRSSGVKPSHSMLPFPGISMNGSFGGNFPALKQFRPSIRASNSRNSNINFFGVAGANAGMMSPRASAIPEGEDREGD